MDRQIVRKNVKESRQKPIFCNYRPQLLFRVRRHPDHFIRSAF